MGEQDWIKNFDKSLDPPRTGTIYQMIRTGHSDSLYNHQLAEFRTIQSYAMSHGDEVT